MDLLHKSQAFEKSKLAPEPAGYGEHCCDIDPAGVMLLAERIADGNITVDVNIKEHTLHMQGSFTTGPGIAPTSPPQAN